MYTYTIGLIEALLQQIFLISLNATGSALFALVFLAVMVRLITQPLVKATDHLVQRQSSLDGVLSRQVQAIKQQYQGEERHRAVKRLYQRFSYSPLLTIRSLSGLAVQLPFFIAAFYMLDTTLNVLDNDISLQRAEVFFVGPLEKQDKILFGQVNLIPFLMFLINIAAVHLAFGQNMRQRRQGLIIATLFFLFLYDDKAGLTLYWTITNSLTVLINLHSRYENRLRRLIPKHFNLLKYLLPSTDYARVLINYVVASALAISAPIIDLMSRNETFFLAHGFSQRSIVIFLIILVIAPPFVTLTIRTLVSVTFRRFTSHLDIVVLCGLLTLFSLLLINNSLFSLTGLEVEAILYLILSACMALLLYQFMGKIDPRPYVVWVVLLTLLPGLNFAYNAPSSNLFSKVPIKQKNDKVNLGDTSVFLIIFDEFSGVTLQNSSRQLNAHRYPGFAKLAENAVYFPNAMAVWNQTHLALPSIASGNFRRRGLDRGNNILDFFNSQTSVTIQSTILSKDLIGPSLVKLNSANQSNFNPGWIVDDLITLYLYSVAHPNWTKRVLGDLPETWAGIGKLNIAGKKYENAAAEHRYLENYESWLTYVQNEVVIDQFNFIHLEFPHVPYFLTARGRTIENISPRPSIPFPHGGFSDISRSYLNVVNHSYLHQVQFTDQIISELVDTLKVRGIYDESLIIVTADHGVSYSFDAQDRRTPVNEHSWLENLSVPLFIKFPDQVKGEVNETLVTSLDITPTIMAVLGLETPWDVQGEDLKAIVDKSESRSASTLPDYDLYRPRILSLFDHAIGRRENLFGEIEPIFDVRVNYTAETKYDSVLGRRPESLLSTEMSELSFTSLDEYHKGEINFAGILTNSYGNEVDEATLAISQNDEVVSITRSGRTRGVQGFVAFSLPELEDPEALRVLKMYEVVESEGGNFKLRFVANLQG